MNRLINEELNKMKYLLGYQRGMVLSEQSGGLELQSVGQGIQSVGQAVQGGLDSVKSQITAPAAAPASGVEDIVKQIQTVLNTKYGAKLAVDGKWGNLTQTAFETAVKSKTAAPAAPATPAAPASSGTTTPAATTTTSPAAPVAPAATTTTAPAAPVAEPATQTPAEITGTEVAQPTRRDMRRDRQDLRRSNRRAMQDLRTQQRAQ